LKTNQPLTNVSQSLFHSAAFMQWLAKVRVGVIKPVAQGNQGALWRYQSEQIDVAVKRSTGRGLVRLLRRYSLRNEYRAYRRLQGLVGIAECYGMVDQDTLVLAYIKGEPYRQAKLIDRDNWFISLQQLVDDIHALGVGHGDLKRKENLLAGSDGQPYVLDFGTAWLHRDGWHPFNHWLFRLSCKTDNNAVIKHKYHGNYADVKGRDLAQLNYTWPERFWRWLRPLLGIK